MRPDFATQAKAAELFAKLGPKLWVLLAQKYDPNLVVRVAVAHDLAFPADAEFADLAARVELERPQVAPPPAAAAAAAVAAVEKEEAPAAEAAEAAMLGALEAYEAHHVAEEEEEAPPPGPRVR